MKTVTITLRDDDEATHVATALRHVAHELFRVYDDEDDTPDVRRRLRIEKLLSDVAFAFDGKR